MSVHQPLAFKDGEWVVLKDQKYLEWDGEAKDRHVTWLIKFIHTRFACELSTMNEFMQIQETSTDWESYMENARVKLLKHDCFSRVEEGSLHYPLTFSCGDCCSKFPLKREKKVVRNELMSFVSDKWRRDPDLLVAPLCLACHADYIDCEGNLDIPSTPMCGLCRRAVDLPKLKRPEDAVLNPPLDDEFEYGEQELAWLHTISDRVSDFWCPACISQTVFCIGADTIISIRQAILRKTF